MTDIDPSLWKWICLSCTRSFTDCSLFVFQWDPMITTLPGLYFISAFLIKPLEFICSSSIVVCSTFSLRSINFLFTAGNAALLFLLSLELKDGDKVNWAKWNGINYFVIMQVKITWSHRLVVCNDLLGWTHSLWIWFLCSICLCPRPLSNGTTSLMVWLLLLAENF